MWDIEAQAGASLRLGAVFDSRDRLVGVAPMVVEKLFGPLNVRVIRLIGNGLSDRQDIIVAGDADTRSVIRQLRTWFAETTRSADILVVDDVSQNSKIYRHWEELFSSDARAEVAGGRREGKSLSLQSAEDWFCIPIDSSWEEYRQNLKKSLRRNIGRRLRRLESDHDSKFWIEDGSIHPERSIESFVNLHQARLESIGERGLFRSSARRRILPKLYRALMDCGIMRLFFIDIGGAPRAVQAVLEFNGRSHWYNVGLDPTPAVLRLGLGKLLCFRALEDAFNSGKREVDLGGGAQAYKADYSPERRSSYRITKCISPSKGVVLKLHRQMLRTAQGSELIRKLYFLGKRLTSGGGQ